MHSANDLAIITQRDRFLRRVVDSKRVFAVAGEGGLARVPSRRLKGRDVTLLWSEKTEAQRWADVITEKPRLKEIALGGLMADILPALAMLRRFVGVDWSSGQPEAEIDPNDLAERIRLEALHVFVHRAMVNRKVWILEDVAGPALLVSHTLPEQLFLPCWADRAEAEARIDGPWRDMTSIEIPLEDFLSRKLRWLEERGHLVAPGHGEGTGSIELSPSDLRERFPLRTPA